MAKFGFLVLIVLAATLSFVQAHGYVSRVESMVSRLKTCEMERDSLAKKVAAWQELVKTVEEEMLSRARATGQAVTTLQQLMRENDSRRGRMGEAKLAHDHLRTSSGPESPPRGREMEEKMAKVAAASPNFAENLMTGQENEKDKDAKKDLLEGSIQAKLQVLAELLSETN